VAGHSNEVRQNKLMKSNYSNFSFLVQHDPLLLQLAHTAEQSWQIDFKLRLDRNVSESFHQIRKLGNEANHDFSSSTHGDALKALQIAWALSCWFHKTFGGDKAKGFTPGKFVKPIDPSEHVRELEAKVHLLEAEQHRTTERLKTAETLQAAEADKAAAEHERQAGKPILLTCDTQITLVQNTIKIKQLPNGLQNQAPLTTCYLMG